MGSFNSHTLKNDDDQSWSSTPIRRGDIHQRTLHQDYDPRSPAVVFDRTPIQVQATPESVIDPRSPTNEILRTPIYGAKSNGEILVEKTGMVTMVLLVIVICYYFH